MASKIYRSHLEPNHVLEKKGLGVKFERRYSESIDSFDGIISLRGFQMEYAGDNDKEQLPPPPTRQRYTVAFHAKINKLAPRLL